MSQTNLADFLWGRRAQLRYLLFAAAIILLTMLGARDIWTQEHRWADIVAGMFYRQDFFHPYLGDRAYYDKPLLSYWLIALIVKLTNQFTAFTLRLPSALSGMLAVWSIYRIGFRLRGREIGFLAGWLLLTTFYFIFWARVSSADMLNLAGSLFAISWYLEHREQTRFFDYAIFFLILAVTSLCKGLVGAVVPVLVVTLDGIMQRSWRQHLNGRMLLALFPAAIVYLLPFLASSVTNDNYSSSGLWLVYRENVLRYFQPFDHKGPIYTYFIYLPIYLLPWTLFLLPALVSLKSRWQTMSIGSKWIVWSLLGLFLFFTCSGSRRNYYVLPIVPFAILLIADWLPQSSLCVAARRFNISWLIGIFFLFAFIGFDIIQPWYYSQSLAQRFVPVIKREAQKIKPWPLWQVVMLDAETKLSFYLHLPPTTPNLDIQGKRTQQTQASLLRAWPVLQNLDHRTLFISRKRYASLLQLILVNYQYVEMHPSKYQRWIRQNDADIPVAFIPISSS